MNWRACDHVLPVLLASACAGCAVAPDYKALDCMSVEEVGALVRELDGKEVAVCGFLKYEFEDKNLYQSRQAAQDYDDSKCLSVGVRDGALRPLSTLNNSWVRVTATVSADFCPADTVCSSSCADSGLFVSDVARLP